MREGDVHYACVQREAHALHERDQARQEREELRSLLFAEQEAHALTRDVMRKFSEALEQHQALATAIENYFSGGMSTAGLRELYAAREALRGLRCATISDTP